jgi:hypothetical protein
MGCPARLSHDLPAAAGYAAEEWRQRLVAACAAHVGLWGWACHFGDLRPATLVIYDVITLCFESAPRARCSADRLGCTDRSALSAGDVLRVARESPQPGYFPHGDAAAAPVGGLADR